jgi:hypothetical protein
MVSQTIPSALDRHTIKVTDLRTETRVMLEHVHFRGWHYFGHRAGQPMIAILDHDEYERLLTLAAAGDGKTVTKERSSGRSG